VTRHLPWRATVPKQLFASITITQQCPIMHMIADKPVQKCQQ
jgi:hypothetical protein